MPPKKSDAVGKLISQRNTVKASIERIANFIQCQGSELSVSELQCRLDVVERYFNEVLGHQAAIEDLDYAPEISNSVTIRGELEDLYCQVKSEILSCITAQSKSEVKHEFKCTTSRSDHLPKLKLPHFSGKYAEYPNFIHLFSTLVDKEQRLSTIEKFNHLLSCLGGAALRTVKALDLTEENYSQALELLESRYNNKHLMCEEHINDLWQLKKVSRGSAEQLRVLVDTVTARFNALITLSNFEEIANAFVVHAVLNCLDTESQQKLEESIDYTKSVSWAQCASTLNKRCQVLEARNNSTNKSEIQGKSDKKASSLSLTVVNNCCGYCKQPDHQVWKCVKFLALSPSQRYEAAKGSQLCINCLSAQHSVKQCKSSTCRQCKSRHHTLLHWPNNISTSSQPEYQSNREQTTASPATHQHQQPSSGQHRGFSQQQLTPQQQQLHSIHQQVNPQQTGNISGTANNSSWSPRAMVSQHLNDATSIQETVSTNDHTILATAVVHISDKFGKRHLARAILDSASQLNFITRSLAQKLNLDLTKATTVVGGIGDSHTKASCSTYTTISSRSSNFVSSLPFLVLPSITGQQPDCQINIEQWDLPSNIELADPRFYIPQRIDLLLGADIFFQLFDGQQIKLGNECPMLLHTEFGWIVSGKCKVNGISQVALVSANVRPDDNKQLEELVMQFWHMEKIPDAKRKFSNEHTDCEAHFLQHTKRCPTGRFMVKLPFKKEANVLGDSQKTAVRRFLSLERRLGNDSQLKEYYVEFLKEYKSAGHMAEIPWPRFLCGHYYLPHHCVLRLDKSTTKCRVVFDASAKTTNGLSLNDILMTGPVVQRDLFEILLRFRLHKFGLMADIAAMYRQILVYPEDQKVQNIVWRDDVHDELQLYSLKTVTYGTSPAPYLATRCLIQLATENFEKFPIAANIVKNDFYVDDLITGGSTLEEIQAIKHDVGAILHQGEFQLRKWHSNHKVFLGSISEDEREKTIRINNADVVKALGIIWDANTDNFKFKFSVSQTSGTVVTKRSVLSELARLFDPMGFIKPLIVKAKVFLQELWLNKLDWDEPLPDDLACSWENYVKQLADLNDIEIPRYVLMPESSVQLHGFADASTRAYGCCFYIRCTDAAGKTQVNLYTAKSKVAPISVVRSVPCLELCAAHLLVQLLEKIRLLHRFDEITLWSDSVIVLSWISEHASNFNTFVANRVSFIQEATQGIKWKYVPSADIPADMVSRGATVQELVSSIWFTGPVFLQKAEEHWPKRAKSSEDPELPERKLQRSILLTVQDSSLLKTIYSLSNFHQICMRFAYIRRFVAHCRNSSQRMNVQSKKLTASELNDALLNIVSMVQKSCFGHDIDLLLHDKPISPNSCLKMLNPFIEVYKGMVLLKVGGRLKNSALPYEAKYPLVLPKNNPVVLTYFRHVHISQLHAGAQALSCTVRERFWVIGARDYARRTVQGCIHCFKYRPKLMEQIMGDLPKSRVSPVKPFSFCGVDFCGPILTTSRIRGKPKYKTYIAVFICFVTKAIHMEVVSDLSADAFIAALKRFIGRRGLCNTLYCDNATNFVGARNILKEFKASFTSPPVQERLSAWCTANNIEFKHIPPRSPHFGGIWEAAVKSAKTILYKAMNAAVLTFEELSTVVAQIEGILNSRPITALSTDPSDEEALTPAHFLNQSRAECIVEPELSFDKISCYKHWQQISTIQQHFWKRWSREYLTMLQQRQKWTKDVPNIKVGALVMIHEDNLPPQKWLLGRITQVFPGTDGKIRVAEVKTAAGILRRAIAKLAAIPVDKGLIETP